MSKYVMPEDFIAKWLEAIELGKGQRWISKELGIGYTRVQQRANYLRKYGVDLPYLMNGRSNRKYQVDRDDWNQRISDFLEESNLKDKAYIEPEEL